MSPSDCVPLNRPSNLAITGRNRRPPLRARGRFALRMGAATTCAAAIALLGGGAVAGASVPAASAPAASAGAASTAIATVNSTVASTGHAAGCRARAISTEIEGSQASPVVPRPPGPVSGLNGFTVHSDAATASGQSGTSGANTGGLLPVGAKWWSPSLRNSPLAGTKTDSGTRGHIAPTRKSDIEGSGASPVVPRPPGPVSGLNGFTVHSDAATASGQNGTSGANTGGLLPVGSPQWSPSLRGSHRATGSASC